MAAAEYFNPNVSMVSRPAAAAAAPVPQQQYQPPRPQPQPPHQQPLRPAQAQSSLNLPYPISDQPPPYSEQPRPHSQPPPGQRLPQPQQNYGPSPYTAYRPDYPQQANADTHQYPEKLPQQPPRPTAVHNGYSTVPSAYPTPVAPGLSQANPGQTWPQQQQQRPTSSGHGRTSRSRSQSRDRRKYHHKPKSDVQRQKSSGMSTLLGAGGGAIIGDLIFPGLGTIVGGAVLGGIGGHEYGKKRSTSNPSRTYRRSYSGSDYYEDDHRRGRR